MQLYCMTCLFMVYGTAFTPGGYWCVGCCHFLIWQSKGKEVSAPDESGIACFENFCSTPVEKSQTFSSCLALSHPQVSAQMASLWRVLLWAAYKPAVPISQSLSISFLFISSWHLALFEIIIFTYLVNFFYSLWYWMCAPKWWGPRLSCSLLYPQCLLNTVLGT